MQNDLFLRFTIVLMVCSVCLTSSSQIDLTCSNLPIIVIDTQGQPITADDRISASMSVFSDSDELNCISNSPDDTGPISIAWRGQTSLTFEKKQYKIETQTGDGENRNVSLMGLPPENDWILYAPYSDKSLIRNALAYSIATDLGHYAPRTRPCELLLNGEYMGIYWLTEKIKRDDNRVDIANLQPTDTAGDELTGGYLLKIDTPDPDPCGWNISSGGAYIQPEYPKCEDMEPEQRDYITSQTDLLFNTIAQSEESIWNMLDLEAAVDYFLVNEVAKNVDAYRISTFFQKKKVSNGGKFHFGPVWDFNIAYGNVDYLEGYITADFIAESNTWWSRMLSDSVFRESLQVRWSQLRQEGNLFHPESIKERIDSLSSMLGPAVARNFVRWDILGHDIWPNYYFGQEYSDDLYYLESWIRYRIAWMDGELNFQAEPFVNRPNEGALLFPNPFSDILNVNVRQEGPGNLEVEFLDVRGVIVYTESFGYREIGQQILHIRGEYIKAAPGILLVQLKVDGQVVYRQLVKKMI